MGKLKQGSDPHIRAIVWVRGEIFKAESETADLWQPTWSENHSPCCSHTTPARNPGPLEGTVAGNWTLGIVGKFQGDGCCWPWGDRSRGCEGGDRGGKCQWRQARQSWKQGDTAESRIGCGVITMLSLPWYASIGSWTTERTAHQTPDAPNYRMRPHPGCPFKCLMCQMTEKDPRQGSPLTAWLGRTMETAQTGLLIANYKKLGKRLIGPWLLQWRQSMSLHTRRLQGPHKPSTCTTCTLNFHWGRPATATKNVLSLCTQGRFSHVQLFETL